MKISTRLLCVCSVIALFAPACGGDDDAPAVDAAGNPDAPAPDASPPDATVFDAATSGKITVEASGITGGTGKIALVGITQTGGGPFLGAICVPIANDPASLSAVAQLPGAANPCDLGAEVVFDNGSYDVQGGLYTPGNMTPDLCANTTVTVAGDTTVTLPQFGACP